MPNPKLNTFSSYNLTEDEEKSGSQLSSLNVAMIQNLRSSIAEEKLNLVFTPNDVLSYTQQEAYLKGQLDILSFLLNQNEDSQQYHHITTQE
jgi:hypothetical protein